jgi:hypothetical protein
MTRRPSTAALQQRDRERWGVTQAIVKNQSPEEREYARYLGEIEVRKRRIADLQADLHLLKEKLGRFNAEYHTRVGALFVELDKINLEIQEYEYRIARLQRDPDLNPEDLEDETVDWFAGQREEVHQDEEETRRYERAYREEQKRPELDERSESVLKSLFRDLARRFHPDLARTEAERQQRESIMKRVNAAFRDRDVDALERIKAETASEDAAFEEKSIGEKMVWAIREVSRLDEVIASLVAERESLMVSDLAKLWQRQEGGEDVVGRLVRETQRDIDQARQRLEQLIDQFHTAMAEARHG